MTAGTLMTADELLQLPRGTARHALVRGESQTIPLAGAVSGVGPIRKPVRNVKLAMKSSEWLRACLGARVIADPQTQRVRIHLSDGAQQVEDRITMPEVIPGWSMSTSGACDV